MAWLHLTRTTGEGICINPDNVVAFHPVKVLDKKEGTVVHFSFQKGDSVKVRENYDEVAAKLGE